MLNALGTRFCGPFGMGCLGIHAKLFTCRAKGANEALRLPSLTPMVMPEKSPESLLVGVPDRIPDTESNFAHAGRLVMKKVVLSPSGSPAVGSNSYLE